jgi:hypothetical protein
MRSRLLLFLGFFCCLSACGKIPESEAAKNIGAQPKQAIDKVNTDLGKAAAEDAARTDPDGKK